MVIVFVTSMAMKLYMLSAMGFFYVSGDFGKNDGDLPENKF